MSNTPTPVPNPTGPQQFRIDHAAEIAQKQKDAAAYHKVFGTKDPYVITPGSSFATTPLERAISNPSSVPAPTPEQKAIDAKKLSDKNEQLGIAEDLKAAEDYKTKNLPYNTQTLTEEGITNSISVMMDANTLKAKMDSLVKSLNYNFPMKSVGLAISSIEKKPATIVILDKKNNIRMQTNKFLLTGLSKVQQERFQVIETFGEPSITFFDERSRMYTMQGILMDADYMMPIPTPDLNAAGGSNDSPNVKAAKEDLRMKKQARYQWAQAFQTFYTEHLRGTRLKEKDFVAAIYVNNTVIRGYPLQLTLSKESQQMPDTVSFQMTWVIEKEFLEKAKTIQYMYDGGVTLNADFEKAFGEYTSAITNYDNLKMIYKATDTLALAKEVRDAMDTAEINIINTEKILKEFLASKNNKFYEVDKNY